MKVLSLFSGIGAFEKALKNICVPYTLVNYCEIDRYASKSYSAIHGVSEDLNLWDITKVDTDKIADVDLITYGFPCQDISVAGKQAGLGEGTRSGLYREAYRIIKAKLPKYAICENVKNLTGKKFKEQFDAILNDLEQLGYTNYWKVLNAKDYGIPQNRERVFIISIRGEHEPYKFPTPFDNGLRLKDMLEDEVDEKYYISQDKVDKLLTQLKDKEISNTVRNGGRGSFDKHMWDCVYIGNVNPSGRGMNGNVFIGGTCPTITTNKGEGLKITIPCLTPDRTEKRQNGRRFKEDGQPMFTLTGQDRHGILHNILNSYRIRKLTPKDCFRLMAFTDTDIQKCIDAGISNSQLYKQAGNSICVNVLEEIFKKLLRLREV